MRKAPDDGGGVARRDLAVGDALQLHVELSGTGHPLVLLHGFTGSTRTWAPLRAALAPSHTVIAIDLPGHGRSSAPADPARYTLSRFADDLEVALDQLGVKGCALLGYSMGGRAALHYAERHPERLSALVLESASPGLDDPAEGADRRQADDALADTIERDGVAEFVRHWEALPLWDSQRSLAADVRAALQGERLANVAAGLANSLRGAGAGVSPSLGPKLGAVHVRTLLVAGSLDAKYMAIGRRMAAAMPTATLAVVAGAGHAVHLERPAEFAALVRDFLRAP